VGGELAVGESGLACVSHSALDRADRAARISGRRSTLDAFARLHARRMPLRQDCYQRQSEWRATGAHPLICSGLGPSLGYPTRRSSGRSRVKAALRRNQSSISAIATNFNRPRRTHRSSGPMCLSKKSDCIQALARPRSASTPSGAGGERDLAHTSAPPICRRVTQLVWRARANNRSSLLLRQVPLRSESSRGIEHPRTRTCSNDVGRKHVRPRQRLVTRTTHHARVRRSPRAPRPNG
jgi:hypothetical protein